MNHSINKNPGEGFDLLLNPTIAQAPPTGYFYFWGWALGQDGQEDESQSTGIDDASQGSKQGQKVRDFRVLTEKSNKTPHNGHVFTQWCGVLFVFFFEMTTFLQTRLLKYKGPNDSPLGVDFFFRRIFFLKIRDPYPRG